MGRARRARKIAQAAAYGSGAGIAGLGVLGALGYGVIRTEAWLARRIVGQPFDSAPDDDGSYGHGPGEPIELVIIGDSTAAGLGADEPHQTVGAIIANGIAAFSGRTVHLTNEAVVGAQSTALAGQVDRALARVPEPDATVISIGANDVTHRINTSLAVGHLRDAVARLRATGSEVVVGTAPDLGAVEPVAQPLRYLARRWSRDLAAAQTVAVVEAGGYAVSMGDLLGHQFSEAPTVMFSRDRFHPSSAGYARVAAALLPTVSAALDLFGERSRPETPSVARGEGVRPLPSAATRAVATPGTEVGPIDHEHAETPQPDRNRRGRLAVLLRRGRPTIEVPNDNPNSEDETDLGDSDDSGRSDSGADEEQVGGLGRDDRGGGIPAGEVDPSGVVR